MSDTPETRLRKFGFHEDADSIARLRRDYELLRKALEVYADKNHWHCEGWLNVFHRGTNGPAIAVAALQEVDGERA